MADSSLPQPTDLSQLVLANDKKTLIPTLHKINKHLEPIVFWVNNQYSDVDWAYFVVLAPLVKSWQTAETHTFDNISRWYDNIQHLPALQQQVTDGGYSVQFVLDVPKPVVQPKQPQQPKAKPNPDQQPKKKAETAPTQTKPEDLTRLELKIGKIVDVKRHPDAEKLYVESIDLGDNKIVTVVSGLVDYIPIEQMRDSFVVCLCNLKPSKLKGITSEAMVIVAQSVVNDKDKELLVVPDGSVAGDSIYFSIDEKKPEGKADNRIDLSNSKNIFRALQSDLHTNDTLQVVWKDLHMRTSKGLITSKTINNANLG